MTEWEISIPLLLSRFNPIRVLQKYHIAYDRKFFNSRSIRLNIFMLTGIKLLYFHLMRQKRVIKANNLMMIQDDRKILETLAKRIRKFYPEALVWVYGSRARGDAQWDSDFDVCIVLPRKNESIESEIRNICWEIGFENERVITTVVLDQNQFENGPMSESALVENILREGIAA